MEKVMVTGLLLFTVLIAARAVETTSVFAQLGESVTLSPPLAGNNHFKYQYWRFGKERVQLAWCNHMGGKGVTTDETWVKKLTVTQDSLTISNVRPENFGSYDFDIDYNGETLKVATFKLLRVNVEVNPPEPLLPGDSLTVSCSVDHRKEHAIYWQRPDGTSITQSSATVAVSGRDHGMWTCVIDEMKRVKVPVRVMDLSPALALQFTSTSSPLSVPCSFPSDLSWDKIKAKGLKEVLWNFLPEPPAGHGAQPRRLFSLSVEDQSWREGEEHRDLTPARSPGLDLSLSRKWGREDDRGHYVCAAKFHNGVTLNRSVHVDVLQIVASPGRYVASGQPVNLSCSVGRPLTSDLRLQWTPPPPPRSSPPPLASDRQPELLAIPAARREDGGKWACALWRDQTRLTTASLTLTIGAKVSVWTLAVICGAAFVVLLLLFIAGLLLLHRRRHRRMRHLRHQLCRCKHPKPKGFYRT